MVLLFVFFGVRAHGLHWAREGSLRAHIRSWQQVNGLPVNDAEEGKSLLADSSHFAIPALRTVRE